MTTGLRPAAAHTPTDRYLFSGEFHYFRQPRATWADQLRRTRDLGFDAVSIYVPWNWHEPVRGAIDFAGTTIPERDLFGALDAIAAADLRCIYRPGPFITAEWRDGGLPAWLWQDDPAIQALAADGRLAGTGRPYPALTYAHPAYERPAVEWLRTSIGAVEDWLAPNGGPIDHLQLDDEPSYWQQLDDPLALDYNPYLVAPRDGGPSRFGAWLFERHGSLDRVNAASGTSWRLATEIEPPRDVLASRADLTRHVDWLDFKLDEINRHVVVLDSAARDAGFPGPISMLFPYLLPLQAAKFAEFARRELPDLELTNECYVSLFSATESPEQKVAHVIACHETYHMWRGPGQGPAFSMELQGSNSSFIPAGVMEMLYAVTIARAVREFNIFMLIGGVNPPGYENGTGSEYDLDAPIGRDGTLRPHAAVLARQMRIVRALEPELLAAVPLRDTWLASYVPYESAALVGGRAGFDDVGAAMQGIFSSGDFGLSNAQSLTALLSLANVSWGSLDLERTDEAGWRAARQLWVPGLAFMDAATQQRLADWVTAGGHLVIGPIVPAVDERQAPCTILASAIFGSALPDVVPFAAAPIGWTQVRTADGALAIPGDVTRFEPPAEATPLAWAEDGAVVAFRRAVGGGTATVLGFPLQYHPVGGAGQFGFASGIVEHDGVSRAASADVAGAIVLEMAGPAGGILCVVNPVERALTTRVTWTPPGSSERRSMPERLPGVEIAGRGARLLPIGIALGGGSRLEYATAELVERHAEPDAGVRLTFVAPASGRFEIGLSGQARAAPLELVGGRLVDNPPGNEVDDLPGAPLALVIEATAAEVTLLFR